MKTISTSGNIALYPSLISRAGGGLACAWYEYSSAALPRRSDIWMAFAPPGMDWTQPILVSGGVSFNSGASLAELADGILLIAWHSWRPPGREPFLRGGDMCNIWVSRLAASGFWERPHLAFPSLSGTEYPSVTRSPDGTVWMLFRRRGDPSLLLSRSADGMKWSPPWPVSPADDAPAGADLCADVDGSLHMVSASARAGQGVLHQCSIDGENWRPVGRVFDGLPDVMHRPRISAAGDGIFYVCAHRSSWGSFEDEFVVELGHGPLEIRIRASGTGGSGCWTLNSIDIEPIAGGRRTFLAFGPGVGVERSIRAAEALYHPERGFGFDEPVEEMFRELGDPIQRSLVYQEAPRILRVDLPAGRYRIRVLHSSWVASRPATCLEINGRMIETRRPFARPDDILLARLGPSPPPRQRTLPTPEGGERNRPSRVVGTPPTIAWTEFDSSRVLIVVGPAPSFEESEAGGHD